MHTDGKYLLARLKGSDSQVYWLRILDTESTEAVRTQTLIVEALQNEGKGGLALRQKKPGTAPPAPWAAEEVLKLHDALPAMIVARNGNVVAANRLGRKMWHLPANMKQPVLFTDALEPESACRFIDSLTRLVRHPSSAEASLLPKSGSDSTRIPITARLSTLADRPELVLAVFDSNAKLAQTERTLAELQAKFRSLYNNHAAGYVYTDLKLDIQEVNKKAAFWMQLNAGVKLKPKINILSYMHNEAKDVVRKHTASSPLEPISFEVLIPITARQTEVLWCDLSPHIDANGQHVGYFFGFVPVTENRELLDKIRESEMRYRSLISHSKDLFLIINPQGRITYALGAAEPVSGMQAEQLIGRRITSLIHPADKRAGLRWENALTANPNQSLSFVLRYQHADGQYRIGDVTASKLLEATPDRAYVVSVRDITERKRSEEALWGYLQLVDSVFSQANDGLMVVDPKTWEVVHINQKAVAYFGSNRNMLATSQSNRQSQQNISNRNLRKLVRSALDNSTSSAGNNMQVMQWQMPNGTLKQVEVMASGLKMGSRQLFLLRFADVSQREEAQKEMKLLRTAVSSTLDAIVICSYERDILSAKLRYANPAFESLTGYEASVWQQIPLGQLLSPEIAPIVGKRINQRLSRKLPFFGEVVTQRADGTELECQWQLSLMLENNKPAHCIIILHDVTELKKVQRTVLQQKLEQQKEVVAAVLNTQEQERKRIAEDIHDGIGHSLSVLKYNISILEDKLRDMPQQVLDLLVQTRQIVDETNTEARNISRNLVPTVLYDFGLGSAIRHLLRNVNPDDRLQIDYNPIPIDGLLEPTVEIALYRILQELLNNIVKYAEATHIRIELACEDGTLTLVVEDNGKGFDYEAIRRKGGGMGLRNIDSRVKLLNGIFVLDAQVGKGTTAIIQLPVTTNLNTSL